MIILISFHRTTIVNKGDSQQTQSSSNEKREKLSKRFKCKFSCPADYLLSAFADKKTAKAASVTKRQHSTSSSSCQLVFFMLCSTASVAAWCWKFELSSELSSWRKLRSSSQLSSHFQLSSERGLHSSNPSSKSANHHNPLYCRAKVRFSYAEQPKIPEMLATESHLAPSAFGMPPFGVVSRDALNIPFGMLCKFAVWKELCRVGSFRLDNLRSSSVLRGFGDGYKLKDETAAERTSACFYGLTHKWQRSVRFISAF